MKLIINICAFLLFSSCANYINQVHRELDGQNRSKSVRKPRRHDAFNQFRRNRYQGATRDSLQTKSLLPKVRRKYAPAKTKKRYSADDLTDNKNPNSLWAGNGNENYLFTKNKWKRNGDIVLVRVQDQLKSEISMELKRAFPVMPKRKKKDKDGKEKEATKETPPEATAKSDQDKDGESKIHDKISSVIIEEISKDHLLLRGQKFLLFRNRKHLVEIQALVARRDIQDDDTIDSSQLLESTVTVLR